MYGDAVPSAAAVAAAAASGASFGGFQDPVLREHIQQSLLRGVAQSRSSTVSPAKPGYAQAAGAAGAGSTSTDSSPSNAELIHELRTKRGSSAAAAAGAAAPKPRPPVAGPPAAGAPVQRSASSSSLSSGEHSVHVQAAHERVRVSVAARASEQAYQLVREASSTSSESRGRSAAMEEEPVSVAVGWRASRVALRVSAARRHAGW